MKKSIKTAAAFALCGTVAVAGFLWYARATGDAEGVTVAVVIGGMFLLLTLLSLIRFKR